jgi:hypothetical protein
MAYTILDLQNDLSGVLHGTTTNQITNFYGLVFRAASNVLSQIDPEETRRTTALSAIYGQAAFDYAAPTDLKGNRFIDLRPLANRMVTDVPQQLRSQDFDVRKTWLTSGSKVEVHNDTGTKTLRIAIPAKLKVTLNSDDGVTENGTWAGTGVATGLADDDYNFVEGSGSIKYSTSGAGNAILTNSTMTDSDLSEMWGEEVIFIWTFQPAAADGTSYRYDWGTDASNYKYNTVTAQWDGTAFQAGWNLLGFLASTATTVGTPTSTAIGYGKLTVAASAAVTVLRLDSIVASGPTYMELEYYSKYLFRDSTGTFKEKPTATTDIINLDTDSYNVLFTEVAKLCAQQQQGKDSGFDYSFFEKEAEKALVAYYRKYPSQAQKATGTYYTVVKSSYANRYGKTVLRP